jgi:hypothetical protein
LKEKNTMAGGCEQLAGELKELEHLLKQTSIEHRRREIIDRIDEVKAEQQKHGCLAEAETVSHADN